MVAAATMSLPERAGGNRDFDYRYAWIRDQCITGEAAAVAGLDDLLESTVRFVSERVLADGPKLRPAYTIDGDPVPSQREVPLPGYPGSPNVVVGNRAGEQFQLDVFGEVLSYSRPRLNVTASTPMGGRRQQLPQEAIAARHDEPDAGIWETELNKYAHSRLACAAGLRRISSSPDRPDEARDAVQGIGPREHPPGLVVGHADRVVQGIGDGDHAVGA